MSPSYL